VINPHREAVASDNANGDRGHHHGGQKQEGEYLHALTARAFSVVASDGHTASLLYVEIDGIRAVAFINLNCAERPALI
jgi:hypothetical protein